MSRLAECKVLQYFLAFKAAAGNLDCSESQNLQLGDLLMIAKASKKDA